MEPKHWNRHRNFKKGEVMSLIAAGVIMFASAGFGVASAVQARNDAADAQDDANNIAAKQNKNAEYAGVLEKRRAAAGKAYEPAYALLADEVKKKPILSESAFPMVAAITAGEDTLRRRIMPGTDITGTAPGTDRSRAIDTATIGRSAGQMVSSQQDLNTAMNLENFNQRRQAIEIGKKYVAG